VKAVGACRMIRVIVRDEETLARTDASGARCGSQAVMRMRSRHAEAEGPLLKRQQQRQSARGVGVHWTRWSYVYLRTDELTPEAAPPQQQWVLVLVLRPLPPPLRQRPLPPLLLPPLLLPLKPNRTPRF